MYRQVKTTPRKRPRQTRSKATVDSILEATARVLIAQGFDGLTTNGVAEAAGVSIGSLYQYFPNKHAVLAELARRLERRTEVALSALLETATDLPLDEVVARAVDALCTGIGGLTFRRALLAEVQSEWTRETSQEVDRALRARVHELLVVRSDIRTGDSAMMVWIVSHGVEGLIESALREQPGLLESPAFRAELATLVTRYLRP